jgi:hypothetical protein
LSTSVIRHLFHLYRMIVCEHLYISHLENGWELKIPTKTAGAIGIFPGQNLFSFIEHETGRMILSPLHLTSMTNYFRFYLNDVRGSLHRVTKVFSDHKLNILSGGGFGFSNIWVSEFLVDFSESGVTSDTVLDEVGNLGGFVVNREITELFPLGFSLDTTFNAEKAREGIKVVSDKPAESHIRRSNVGVVKAWPRLRALFIDFYTPDTKLVHIEASIKDQPGSLMALSDVMSAYVNLNAIDEAHHAVASGEWNAYGELVTGSIKELNSAARRLDNVLKFKAELLT